eukprot:8084646-Alexandrium_andersonii.AAC.1
MPPVAKRKRTASLLEDRDGLVVALSSAVLGPALIPYREALAGKRDQEALSGNQTLLLAVPFPVARTSLQKALEQLAKTNNAEW